MKIQYWGLLALLSLLTPGVAHAATPAPVPIPVILDTDMGDDIDDALALALALQSPELKIEAIVTVLNDGPRRADLTWKILELFHRTDIPVGIGAEDPLLAKPRTGTVKQTEALPAGYHMPATLRRNGLELFIETCLKSPRKITVLAYGPLTNVALALRAEPRLKNHIERIILMNGVFFRPGLEYNTKVDPEASAIVYSYGLPITTVGLDVTLQCRLSQPQLDRLAASTQPTVQFLYQLIQIWQGGNPNTRPILHDPLAIAVAVKPALVTTQQGRVTVETHGTVNETYGMTVFHKDPAGTVQVAQEVSSADAIDLFLTRILAAPRVPE